MRILMTTFGTRGDIQPFVALGQGLQAAGHQVRLCTAAGYEAFVEEHGLTYQSMRNDVLELTQAAMTKIDGLGDAIRAGRAMGPAIRRTLDDEWTAATSFQPDLTLYHPKCLGSYHVAEKLDLPAVVSLPLPFLTPTSAFPVPFLSRSRTIIRRMLT